jgi:hypothetical protein
LGGDEQRGRESRGVEDRVEKLAAEIASLIDHAELGERKDLRDLAIGVLRERVGDAGGPQPLPASAAAPQAFNPLGIGLPLLLVGGVLVFLFPPIGLLILLLAAAMLVWGLVAALRFR